MQYHVCPIYAPGTVYVLIGDATPIHPSVIIACFKHLCPILCPRLHPVTEVHICTQLAAYLVVQQCGCIPKPTIGATPATTHKSRVPDIISTVGIYGSDNFLHNGGIVIPHTPMYKIGLRQKLSIVITIVHIRKYIIWPIEYIRKLVVAIPF